MNILTYWLEIVTYWKLYCYIPLINKAFEPISHFTYLIILLTEYAIKWGFNSYLPMKILLHTPEIFLLHRRWGRTIGLRTISIFLHTDSKLLRTGKLFFPAFPWWLETSWKWGFQSFQKYFLRKLWIDFLSADLNKALLK